MTRSNKNLFFANGIIAGIFVGIVLFTFEKTLFKSSTLSGVHSPFWMGILASLYGAINEEVLLRLFLFTVVYFIVCKWIQVRSNNRSVILWCINIFIALLFGLGHIPAALKLMNLTGFEMFWILFLNGIAGIVFGYLYWTRGIWTAIGAHFVADLLIHAFLK